eukprot:3023087-Amphidinium_carterae.1
MSHCGVRVAEARKELYFFKIIALSGRSCIIALLPFLGKHTLLMLTCNKLGLEYSESQELSRSHPNHPLLSARTHTCTVPT